VFIEESDVKEAQTEPRGAVVYRLLRRAIIEQALLPGTRLPEDTIGDQYGVSRTIVRQALVRLQSEGLVETKPNRGAFVATPSLEEARQIFEVRHCLEREVIRRLAERISVLGLDALEAHVAREAQVKNKDGPRSVRLAGEFHNLLAELTGNAILARYVAEVVSRCSLILAIYGRSHSSDCAVDEHRQIIAAVRAGDAEAAMAIMSHHLGAVEERARLVPDETPDLEAVLARYAKEFVA
jgi:DNA-binding GntR family transcriptional regulator